MQLQKILPLLNPAHSPVYHDIGVAPNGRSEVRVQRHRETVVVVLWHGVVGAAAVERLRHAAGGQDAHQLVEVAVALPGGGVQGGGQRLRGGRVVCSVRW